MFNNRFEMKLKEKHLNFLKIQLDKNNNGFVEVFTETDKGVFMIKNNSCDNDLLDSLFDIEKALKLIEEKKKTMKKSSSVFTDIFFIRLDQRKNKTPGFYEAVCVVCPE